VTKYHAHILLLTVSGSKLFDHPSYSKCDVGNTNWIKRKIVFTLDAGYVQMQLERLNGYIAE